MSINPALGRQRQDDQGFQTRLSYVVSSMTAWATLSQNKTNRNENVCTYENMCTNVHSGLLNFLILPEVGLTG